MKTASWVIVEKATGRAVWETFSPQPFAFLKPAYEAVPIGDYLGSLNAAIKRGDKVVS